MRIGQLLQISKNSCKGETMKKSEKKTWTKKREAALKAGRFVVKPSDYNGFHSWIFPDTVKIEEVAQGFVNGVIKKNHSKNYYEVLPMVTQHETITWAGHGI